MKRPFLLQAHSRNQARQRSGIRGPLVAPLIIFVLISFCLQLTGVPALALEFIDQPSGRLMLAETDLSLPAGPVTLEVRRHFQPDAEAGLLGKPWTLNWEIRLIRLESVAFLETAEGVKVFLPAESTTEYAGPAGDRLVFDSSGTSVCRYLDGNEDHFDPSGRLVRRDFRNGNRATLTYNAQGALSRIDGPFNTRLFFVTDENGRLTAVQTSTGVSVRYQYAQGRLEKVVGADGSTTRYTYDVAGMVTEIDRPKEGTARIGYDSRGRVLSRRWADGARETYHYDDAANTIRRISPAGGIFTLRMGEEGRTRVLVDPIGNETTAEYDELGRPLTVTGPGGLRTRFLYDDLGRLVSMEGCCGQWLKLEYVAATSFPGKITSEDGSTQIFQYDDSYNLTAVEQEGTTLLSTQYRPDGLPASLKGSNLAPETYTYGPQGRLASRTDALGNTTRFKYDTAGNLIREIDPAGGETSWKYDSRGRLTAVQGPAGGVTRYVYDEAARVTQEIDPTGAATRYQYDARGRVAAVSDPLNRTTRYSYDAEGRIIQIVFPDHLAQTFAYDPVGNLISQTDNRGLRISYQYDASGRKVSETRGTGLQTNYRYNPRGELIGWSDNLGGEIRIEYDEKGYLKRIQNAAGGSYQYHYDAAGRMIEERNFYGGATRREYGSDGNLEKLIDPAGAEIHYTYDRSGQLTGIVHPGQGITGLQYSPTGGITKVTQPFNNYFRYVYDPAGRVKQRTDPGGQTTTFIYDAAGRLLRKSLSDGTRVNYTYNSAGDLIEIDDGNFPIRYTYNEAGLLTQIDCPAIHKSLTYRYSDTGLLAASRGPDGSTVRYEYDDHGRVNAIRLEGRGAVTYEYDPKDRVTAVSYPNGIRGMRTYDTEGRPLSISYRNRKGEILSQWRYSYDIAGNLMERTDQEGRITRYRYDGRGQLIEEAAPRNTTNYRYLPDGNRASRTQEDSTVEYAYDVADRILRAGDESFEHDENGNLTSRKESAGFTEYHYDAHNHLVRARHSSGTEVSFGYGPTGQRIRRKDVSGLTWFVNDGTNLVAELDGRLDTRAVYVHAPGIDRPVIMLLDGEAYFYHPDAMGSVAFLTNAEGEVAASYETDAFGVLTSQDVAIKNPFLFTGREYEPDLGLYYYRARYYDPLLGRFLSQDSEWSGESPLSLNRYVYAYNNPLRFSDPTGRSAGDQLRNMTPTQFETFLRGRTPGEQQVFRQWYHQHSPNAGAPTAPAPGAGTSAPFPPRPPGTGASSPGPRTGPPPPALPNPDGPSFSPSRVVTGVGAIAMGAKLVTDYAACVDQKRSRAECATQFIVAAGVAASAKVLGPAALAWACAKLGISAAAVMAYLPYAGALAALYGLNRSGQRWAEAPMVPAQKGLDRTRRHVLLAGYDDFERAMLAEIQALTQLRAQALGACQAVKTDIQRGKEALPPAGEALTAVRGKVASIKEKTARCSAGNAGSLKAQIEGYRVQAKGYEDKVVRGVEWARATAAACASEQDAIAARDTYQNCKGLAVGIAKQAGLVKQYNEQLKALHKLRDEIEADLAGAEEKAQEIGSAVRSIQSTAAGIEAKIEHARELKTSFDSKRAALRLSMRRYRYAFPKNTNALDKQSRAAFSRFTSLRQRADLVKEIHECSAEHLDAGEMVLSKLECENLFDQAQNQLATARAEAATCERVASGDAAVEETEAAANYALLAVAAGDDIPTMVEQCMASLAKAKGSAKRKGGSASAPAKSGDPADAAGGSDDASSDSRSGFEAGEELSGADAEKAATASRKDAGTASEDSDQERRDAAYETGRKIGESLGKAAIEILKGVVAARTKKREPHTKKPEGDSSPDSGRSRSPSPADHRKPGVPAESPDGSGEEDPFVGTWRITGQMVRHSDPDVMEDFGLGRTRETAAITIRRTGAGYRVAGYPPAGHFVKPPDITVSASGNSLTMNIKGLSDYEGTVNGRDYYERATEVVTLHRVGAGLQGTIRTDFRSDLTGTGYWQIQEISGRRR